MRNVALLSSCDVNIEKRKQNNFVESVSVSPTKLNPVKLNKKVSGQRLVYCNSDFLLLFTMHFLKRSVEHCTDKTLNYMTA